jgi:hypothetical protein
MSSQKEEFRKAQDQTKVSSATTGVMAAVRYNLGRGEPELGYNHCLLARDAGWPVCACGATGIQMAFLGRAEMAVYRHPRRRRKEYEFCIFGRGPEHRSSPQHPFHDMPVILQR